MRKEKNKKAKDEESNGQGGKRGKGIPASVERSRWRQFLNDWYLQHSSSGHKPGLWLSYLLITT